MEQTSPDILIGMGKIRVERMITLSLQIVRLPVQKPDRGGPNCKRPIQEKEIRCQAGFPQWTEFAAKSNLRLWTTHRVGKALGSGPPTSEAGKHAYLSKAARMQRTQGV
jgi:hypothetical protein